MFYYYYYYYYGTSGFMDDVTFGCSGPYGGHCHTGAESDVYECLV